MIAHPKFSFSPQEYLEWEEQQDIRYEYAEGEVYAMTGGTIPHSAIAVNFVSLLKSHLRGRGCQVLNSDAKVGITEEGPFFYPDVNVTCDERDRTALKFVQYPCLIAEVLSPTTEAYDRGGKFAQYRQLESLKEYVLISSDSINVEIFRLNQNNKWELTPYSKGDEIQLVSVDLKFSIDLLYEDINLNLDEESLTIKE
ncbi:Uma2 family endonuclease [Leptolyngbya sp. AN03gr2]|uniref:Uma2 family endonuclease n=1 Tax=unclassified Leptolyngbya TaxID=2650499 RepID=UPI003D31AE64